MQLIRYRRLYRQPVVYRASYRWLATRPRNTLAFAVGAALAAIASIRTPGRSAPVGIEEGSRWRRLVLGGDYVPREISCMADEGRLVFIAVLGGWKTELNIASVMQKVSGRSGSAIRPIEKYPKFVATIAPASRPVAAWRRA